MVLSAAFEALYAGLPGGLVMPCFEPVTTIAQGFESDAAARTDGRKVDRPRAGP